MDVLAQVLQAACLEVGAVAEGSVGVWVHFHFEMNLAAVRVGARRAETVRTLELNSQRVEKISASVVGSQRLAEE